jgi:DNA polymerase-3 subunit alpha
MAVYEKLLEGAQQSRKSKVDGQLSLFEIPGDLKDMTPEESYPELNEFTPRMLLAMEKEMLGLYVSGHPLKEYEKELEEQVTLYSYDLGDSPAEGMDTLEGGLAQDSKNLADGMLVTVGGIITEKKTKTTKSNNLMAFITLEDLFGSMEIIVFPTILTRYSALLVNENAVFIDGRISIKEEEQPKIICDSVRPIRSREAAAADSGGNGREQQYNRTAPRYGASQRDVIPQADGKERSDKIFVKTEEPLDSEIMKSTVSLVKYFSGNTPICFCSPDGVGNITKTKMEEYRVDLCETLHRELIERFGEENVKIVAKYR